MKNGPRNSVDGSPPAARLPHLLTGRAIRLRPTGYGAMFLVVLGVMLAGSIRYNNNLGFLLSFLLGSMVVVSLFHTRRNLEGIRIVSCSAPAVFAGQTAEFLLVADPGGRQRPAVFFKFEHTESRTMGLPAEKMADLALRTPVLVRGLFAGGTLQVATRYPIGLFAARVGLQTSTACLVYPRPLAGPFDPVQLEGGVHDRGRGTGQTGSDDFKGLKAYEPGDPLQRLSWKAFSRGMGLYTKDFVSAVGASVCLDWFRLEGLDTEQRLGRLCDMVLAAQRMGRPFGLRLPAKAIDVGSGLAHGRRCLAELALFGANGPGRSGRAPQDSGS